MAKLTAAGRKMVGDYLTRWRLTRDWGSDHRDFQWTPLKVGLDREGNKVLVMPLTPGSGQEAATARKLIRDGFAIGQYSWTQGRNLVVTDAGVQEYLAEQVLA